MRSNYRRCESTVLPSQSWFDAVAPALTIFVKSLEIVSKKIELTNESGWRERVAEALAKS